MLMNILINGMVASGIYAVLAVGFALIFGVAKLMNMAHTSFYMIAAFLLIIATDILAFPLLPSAVAAVFITVVIGIGCYKLFLDRIKEHESAVMIISIALAMLFQEVFLYFFSGHYRGLAPFISGFTQIFGVRVSYQRLLAIGITFILLAALRVLLKKTRIGTAIRAVAQDSEIACAMGIDVSRICMIVMAISVALASIAGVVIAPIYVVNPLMWVDPLIVVLAAVILGGMGSIYGSVIAAVILGFSETAVVFLIPGGSFLRGAVSLSIMVIVLMIRPEGLFGVAFEEERL